MEISEKLAGLHKQLASLTETVAVLQKEVTGEAASKGNHQQTLEALAGYLAFSPGMQDNEQLNMTLQCAMHVVGAGGAGLTIFDRAKQKLVFQAAIGDGSEGIIGYEVPLQGSQHGLAFATGEVQSSTPLHSGAEEAARAVFRNVLVAPLIVDGEGVGTMSAVNKQDGDHFSRADMEAYQLFADLAAGLIRQTIRSRVFERHLKGELAGSDLPAELADLPISEEDRLLLETIQNLIGLARSRDDLLPFCGQLIGMLADSKRF